MIQGSYWFTLSQTPEASVSGVFVFWHICWNTLPFVIACISAHTLVVEIFYDGFHS